MRVLFLNQAFHPDVVASGQVLTDVAVSLARAGHDLTIITADSGYDNPARRFPSRETWNGIDIIRIRAVRAGKDSRWRRAIDFGSFLILCALRLASMRKHDVVVAMTSPPLISVLGALYARLRGARLVVWLLDVNPDEAIAAGWLARDSYAARMLQSLLDFSLRVSTHVVVLDRFMRDRILARGIAADKIAVIPPWSHDDEVMFDRTGRERFRRQHGLHEKFVVMYAGNHSPCHPLDTLLYAARELRTDSSVAFVFVGGGSQVEKVRRFARDNGLENILQVPYQPLIDVGGMLSAADLHVVALGDPFVGIVHPCKIYNILRVGSDVLYIGPAESHVADIANRLPDSSVSCFRHGNVAGVAGCILEARSAAGARRRSGAHAVAEQYSQASLVPQLTALIAEGADAVRPMVDGQAVIADGSPRPN